VLTLFTFATSLIKVLTVNECKSSRFWVLMYNLGRGDFHHNLDKHGNTGRKFKFLLCQSVKGTPCD